MKRAILVTALAGAAGLGLGTTAAQGDVLTTLYLQVSSGAGQTGAGASTTVMTMSDGTVWSGGAAGVQGSQSTKVGGGSPAAGNTAFKFNSTSSVADLNATYGLGQWAIGAVRLTLQYTLYANNTRFGGGAGTFDIYWVSNDGWSTTTSTPPFVTTAAGLSPWADEVALLAALNFDWTTPGYTGLASEATTPAWVTDKTGSKQATVSYSLALDSLLTQDLAAGGNTSLYLLATSPTMGMTIFTGGGAVLPTLEVDIVPVPEPATLALTILAGTLMLRRRNRA